LGRARDVLEDASGVRVEPLLELDDRHETETTSADKPELWLDLSSGYRPFVGGHNHMVDKLHFLAPGDGSGGVDEYCFCFVSRQ